jgi:hypothetical protein
MTRMELFAAWCWDHIPGGAPTQLWIWGLAPRLAQHCEAAANRRDEVS